MTPRAQEHTDVPISPPGGGDAIAPDQRPAAPSSDGGTAARAVPTPAAPIALPARLVRATREEWRDEMAARSDAAIERAVGEGRAEIALDLRETVDVDVSGLGLLVVVRQRAHDRGVSVHLLHVSPAIRELLALTRLDKLFDVGE